MAVTAHFSPATLARAAAGHSLPSREVVIAYAIACGGDREEWEQRWRACAGQVAQACRDDAAVLPAADSGEGGSSPQDDRVPHAEAAAEPARQRTRQNALVLLVSVLTVLGLLIGIGARGHALDQASLAGTRTTASAGTPQGAQIQGRACSPDGIVALAPKSAATGPAQVRTRFVKGFDPKHDGWDAWWNPENLTEGLTTEHTSGGAQSLMVRVTSGETAIGTIHLHGLRPGGTVSIRIWYSGQGEGQICPFVQTKKGTIEWIPQQDLKLGPSDWPGWRNYTWRIPGFEPLGTGIQLNDTGASDFTILLGTVSW